MRLVFFLLIIAYFLAPLQVKTITHSHQRTTVDLWIPQVLKVDGSLTWSSSLIIDVQSTRGLWNLDRLRDVRFWCGKDWCSTAPNPIYSDWVKTLEIIDATEKELITKRRSLQDQLKEVARLSKYIDENSCESAIRPPLRPTWACTTQDEAEVAKQLCYIKEFGAKGCEKLTKDKIPGDMPSLVQAAIAREGCAGAMAEITGFEFNPGEKTIKKYTDELPLTLAIEGLKKLWKLGGEAAEWLVTGVKAQACVPAGVSHCRNLSSQHEQALSEFTADKSDRVKYCTQALALKETANAVLARLQDTVAQYERMLVEFQQKRQSLEKKIETINVPHLLS